MTKRYFLVALVILAVAGAQAYAGDRGFYVGGGVGIPNLEVADYDDYFDNLKFENTSVGFKLFGGYRISKYFAVEGAYTDYSNVKHHEIHQWGEFREINVAIDSWDLSAIGRLPLGRVVALYVRFGGASYSADVRTTIDEETENWTVSGTDITYGGGIDFLAKNFGVRIAFDWLEIEDTAGVFMPTASLTYTF